MLVAGRPRHKRSGGLLPDGVAPELAWFPGDPGLTDSLFRNLEICFPA
jgi:hypothetical protein